MDDDFRERQIEVAFRPRDGRFEVADAAIRRDPEWIPDISALWASGKSSYQMVKGFLDSLNARSELQPDEEEFISHNLDRLFDLQKYPFTALEIAPSVDEEQVADIFVRINSEGVKLNQADFILTLLSVFWDEGRHALESFCRAARARPISTVNLRRLIIFSNQIPDQLLRVSVACGFGRGRLKSVYQVLRGKDLETGAFSADRRDAQFQVLKSAQKMVLDLTRWHQFLGSLLGAGFKSAEMISSQNALLYAYAFYLIGRTAHSVPEYLLQKAIGRWFFFSSLTGRYTSSPETVMDGDLNRLKGVASASEFVQTLDALISRELTNDYWTIRLPADLDSSSARNPQLFAYLAAQNLLGAPVLFSHKRIGDLIDPAVRSNKKALERHHLFPRAWLEKQGIVDLKAINQMANYALLEWPENISISDTAPKRYVTDIRPRFSTEAWEQMQYFHALPEGWEEMQYLEFLPRRRDLMAGIIRRGFEMLG